MLFRSINLVIRRGEYVAIIGANGAGKSTLVKCICRVNERGSTGTARLASGDLYGYSRKSLARIVSYVPQSTGRRMPFSVRAFVEMARYSRRGAFETLNADDYAAVNDALETAELTTLASREMDTLSGGESTRAYIAAALAQDADAILLDEPTASLDPKHIDDALSLLTRINRSTGKTIIHISHDINIAATVASRIVALKGGRMIYDGKASEILDNDRLEPIYGKRFIFATHPETGARVIVPGGLNHD